MTRSIVSDLLRIFKSSVSAVLPENLIKRSVKYNNISQQLTIAGENFSLQNKNVYLIGTGKAVQNMAIEIESILSTKIKQGIISIPVGSSSSKTQKNIFYYEGAKNNLPDANSEATAIKIKDLVAKLGADDLLLVLISGGGSALLSLPKPPITLKEKTDLIKNLANSGADIKELNTVRKRLSDLKGGQLAVIAQPAQVVSLVLSDIVGDPLDLIASGPTTENQDDPTKAAYILNKYKLFEGLPKSIKTVLNKSDNKEQFPKNKVRNHVIGSNKISIATALEEARNMNYCAIGLSDTVTGDVNVIASEYAILTKLFCSFLKGEFTLEDLKLNLKSCHIPGLNTNMVDNSMKGKDLCLVLGGEITVKVNGKGIGGRNQQLALEFSNYIDHIKSEFDHFDIHFLSAGTDGIDGPTDAAGAIGYLDLIMEAKQEKLNVQKYLDDNDSYNFYKKFKNGSLHVITGHTNTNVMDIHVIIIRQKK
ncbi:glycerate kinase [Anticarsia gemmatalis]|uniref:glycerate kinase n=1 Tax=Anticarsia gemmatalis TaxID=129554 RepID=UPI003F76C0E7